MAARLVTKSPAVEDVRKLTGPEKAAVVLLSLGEEHTALWERLEEDEIKEVSQAMAGLGTVTADNVAAALAVERHVAVGALRFWAAHDVVRELPAPSGVFEVCS